MMKIHGDKHLNRLNGMLGEDLAATFLQEQNFTILVRNYRCTGGEIDIVALQDEVVHFVEVKWRTNDLVSGRYAVNHHKQHHIKKAAQAYLSANPRLRDCFVSFDVIEITDGQIEFLENCFY